MRLLILSLGCAADVNLTAPRLLASRSYTFAHEGPVWIPGTDTLLFTSFRQRDDTGTLADSSGQYVEISTVNLSAFNDTRTLETHIWSSVVTVGNGAFVGRDGMVYILSQGNFETVGGVFSLDPTNNFKMRMSNPRPLVQMVQPSLVCKYMKRCDGDGATFNSLNDIVEDYQSGVLIFSDPIYGWTQGFRPTPRLGNFLWIQHSNGTQDVLDTNFSRPNGMAFDGRRNNTLYVTDTGYAYGNGTKDLNAPNAIYKYDVERDADGAITGITNRSLFADIPGQVMNIADGIKVDIHTGYVFAGLGNGVGVWEDTGDGGRLLQVIPMPGGEHVPNLALVPHMGKTLLVAMSDFSIYVTEIRQERAALV